MGSASSPSAAAIPSTPPPSAFPNTDSNDLPRPSLPFENPPSTWEKFREAMFLDKGERDPKSKRFAVLCRMCKIEISAKAATKEHLLRHLYHGNTGEKSFPYCTKLSTEEITYLKGILPTIALPVGNRDISVAISAIAGSGSPDATGKQHSPTIDTWFSRPLTSTEIAELNSAMALFFATSAVSFRLADNYFFRKFCHLLRPQYNPLSARTVSSTAMEKEFYIVRAALRKKINESDVVNLLLDGWTDIQFRSIYAFIISFPEDGKEYLFDVKDISLEHHTGEYLATLIESVIHDIELCGRRIVHSVVTDNAANVKLARETVARKNGFQHIFCLRCFMHAFGNVMKKILDLPFAENLVKRANAIVKYFKSSHIPAALVREKIFVDDDTSENNGRGLTSSNKTRMTSVQMCLQNLLASIPRLRKVIDDMGTSFTNGDVKSDVKSFTFEYHLRELHELIVPFAKCTMAIQSKVSRLSDVVRYWIFLTNSVEAYLERHIAIPQMEEFKCGIAVIVNKATNEIPVNTASICLFLDPRYRSVVKDAAMAQALQMKVIKTAQGRGISDDALVKIVHQLAAYTNDLPPFDTFAFGGNEFDPRSWWQSKCSSVSGVSDLARMALLYFSIPASAAAPERIFSLFDWFQSKRRNSMSIKKLVRMATIKQFYEQEISLNKRTSSARKRHKKDEGPASTRRRISSSIAGQSEKEYVVGDRLAVDDPIEMPDLDESDLEEDRDCFDFDDEENALDDNVDRIDEESTTVDESPVGDEERENLTSPLPSSVVSTTSGYVYKGPKLQRLVWFDYSSEKFSLDHCHSNLSTIESRREPTFLPVKVASTSLSDTELKRLISDANSNR